MPFTGKKSATKEEPTYAQQRALDAVARTSGAAKAAVLAAKAVDCSSEMIEKAIAV